MNSESNESIGHFLKIGFKYWYILVFIPVITLATVVTYTLLVPQKVSYTSEAAVIFDSTDASLEMYKAILNYPAALGVSSDFPSSAFGTKVKGNILTVAAISDTPQQSKALANAGAQAVTKFALQIRKAQFDAVTTDILSRHIALQDIFTQEQIDNIMQGMATNVPSLPRATIIGLAADGAEVKLGKPIRDIALLVFISIIISILSVGLINFLHTGFGKGEIVDAGNTIPAASS